MVRSCFPSTGADRERKIDSFSAVRLFSFGSSVALFLLGSLSLPGDFPTFHDEAYETLDVDVILFDRFLLVGSPRELSRFY